MASGASAGAAVAFLTATAAVIAVLAAPWANVANLIASEGGCVVACMSSTGVECGGGS